MSNNKSDISHTEHIKKISWIYQHILHKTITKNNYSQLRGLKWDLADVLTAPVRKQFDVSSWNTEYIRPKKAIATSIYS